jgi:hypothetical protein
MKLATDKPGKPILRIAPIAVAALILIAGILIFVFRDRIFEKGIRPDAARAVPTGEMIRAAEKSGFGSDPQYGRMKALLIADAKTSPYILSWYLLPGQLLSMTPGQSAYVDASDQAILMRLYVARGDRRAARALSEAIATDFADGTGGLLDTLSIESVGRLSGKSPVEAYVPELEQADRIEGSSLEASLSYMRALLEYTGRWGGTEEWERIRSIASSIYTPETGFLQDHVILASQTENLMVGLVDYEEYFDGIIEPPMVFRALKLSALDLRALQILATTDATYAPMYEEALGIVRGGYISAGVPLYALAYSPTDGDYFFFTGEEARISAVPSLQTMLSLAEVGELPRESLSWIREQIYNVGFIYTEYDIISGATASETEATEAYGLILRIALVEGDTDLYSRTLTRLSRSMATLDTSPARYMIFRKWGERRNMVFAADNLSVLMATTG